MAGVRLSFVARGPGVRPERPTPEPRLPGQGGSARPGSRKPASSSASRAAVSGRAQAERLRRRVRHQLRLTARRWCTLQQRVRVGAEGPAGSCHPGSSSAGTPARAATSPAASSWAAPAPARRRAMPPSASSASVRRAGAAGAGRQQGLSPSVAAAERRTGRRRVVAGAAAGAVSPGSIRALAWMVSKVTVRVQRGSGAGPLRRRRPHLPAPARQPSAPGHRPAPRPGHCSENGVSAGAGGSRGIRTIPRLTTRRAVSEKTAYRKYRLRALISVLSSFTTDHVVTPEGKPGAPLRPENR